MSLLARIVAGAIVAALFTGCASTTAKLPPRNLIALQQVQRVAVLRFAGPEELSEKATADVISAVRNSGAYQIAELPSMSDINGGVVTKMNPMVMHQARMLGVGAVITGKVRVRTDTKALGGSLSFGDPTVYSTVSAEMLDVTTGQSLYKLEATRSYMGELESSPKSRDSLQNVLARLTEQSAQEVGTKLGGRDGTTQVQLAGATWGSGAAEIKEGNQAAERGDWSAALVSYQEALEENPDSHAAMYNLGLANEALGNSVEAIKLFKKARQYGDKDMYAAAARRVESTERDALLAMTRAAQYATQTQPHYGQPYGPQAGRPVQQQHFGPHMRTAGHFAAIRRLPPVP